MRVYISLMVRAADAAAQRHKAAAAAAQLFGEELWPNRTADGTWVVSASLELRGVRPESPAAQAALDTQLVQLVKGCNGRAEGAVAAPLEPHQWAAVLGLAQDARPLPRHLVLHEEERCEAILARVTEVAAALAPVSALISQVRSLEQELKAAREDAGGLQRKLQYAGWEAESAKAEVERLQAEVDRLKAVIASAADALRKGRIGKARRALRGA